MPVSGPDIDRYGGLTTCYEIVTQPGHRLLIDLGTGVHNLLPTIDLEVDRQFDVFFTHFHWDHTHGVPFFRPLYNPRNTITFHGSPSDGLNVEPMLAQMMTPPWFPVRFDETAATKVFDDLGGSMRTVGDVDIQCVTLYHPSGVTAYRFESQGKSIVLVTDVESAQWSDEKLIELARGADVLIHDAQYFPDEYLAGKVGWGHSTWKDAVRIAEAAGVGRLVLTSHDPNRTDKGVDELVAAADEHVPTVGASVGLQIDV
jgi:phosphoribosyl 1,2-cyclic phosphodiesterase